MISWQEIVAKEAVSVCSHQYLLPQVNIGKTTRKVVFFFPALQDRVLAGWNDFTSASAGLQLPAAGLVLSAQTWL